jgi:hypothetical protein
MASGGPRPFDAAVALMPKDATSASANTNAGSLDLEASPAQVSARFADPAVMAAKAVSTTSRLLKFEKLGCLPGAGRDPTRTPQA